jgi:hypothetical protein
MRLSALATPLLLASTSFAGSPHSRAPHRRAQQTDVCANIDADLVFPDVIKDGKYSYLGVVSLQSHSNVTLGKPYVAGHINIGLCVSQVTVFVGHYNVTEAAVKVVGKDKVESTVVAMVSCASAYAIATHPG